MQLRSSCLTYGLVTVTLLLAGCGGAPFALAKVSGKVTLKGRPVTQGKVLFRPEKGPVAVGALGPGGTYTLMTYKPGDGAIVGECSVAIDAPTWGAPMAGFTPPPPPPPEETIPLKFHSYETSGLKRTVEAKENIIDFELADL